LRVFLPPCFWEDLIRKMKEEHLPVGITLDIMGISPSTYYRKKKQYDNGGVLPRKPGTGRKPVYDPKDYEEIIREALNVMGPACGDRRVWIYLRRKGITMGKGTVRKLIRALGLSRPRQRGSSQKKYEAIQVEAPNQIVVSDNIVWWTGRRKTYIYTGVDACSRYGLRPIAFFDRNAESTIEFFEQSFKNRAPVGVHTDNGTEFDNRNARAYLEGRNIQWSHGPSHTPQSQGLIERFNRTLKEEWLDYRNPMDIYELQKCLDDFWDWYNRVRTHMAIGDRTPEEVHYAA